MITSREDYLLYMQEIQQNTNSLLTRVPPSEPIITINLNSREIILPTEFSTFLSVEKDHAAETVYFEVDRYYDDVDLADLTCVVEYVNAAGEGRIFPVVLKDVDSKAGKMIFGWLLSGDVTKKAGDIHFAVRFYSIYPNNSYFAYNLGTLPCTAKILQGMEDVSADENYDFEAGFVEQVWDEIIKLKQCSVAWIDV